METGQNARKGSLYDKACVRNSSLPDGIFYLSLNCLLFCQLKLVFIK